MARNTRSGMVPAIYLIRNTANAKVYVGCSANVEKRISCHRRELQKGSHGNVHLQAAWNKYGPGSFEFVVLRVDDPNELVELEQQYIDAFQSTDPEFGYNGYSYGQSSTPESRARARETQKGWKHTAEARAKMSAAHKGRKHTAETRAKMSAAQRIAQRGRVFSAEHKARLSASMKGKKHGPPSAETRAKIGAGLKRAWARGCYNGT